MSLAKKLLEEGKGILRLAPTWVPRSFCRPGKRIKLHPDDYYVFGLETAKEGVVITNTSTTEPIVMLKHFAENPELEL